MKTLKPAGCPVNAGVIDCCCTLGYRLLQLQAFVIKQ